MNKVDGRRVSAAQGYLGPARRRSNLAIRPNTLARRVVFEGRTVKGIEVETGDWFETIDCRQVALCAGSIMTPPLLLRSGVGPRALVEELGIALAIERPGVAQGCLTIQRRSWPSTRALSTPTRTRPTCR